VAAIIAKESAKALQKRKKPDGDSLPTERRHKAGEGLGTGARDTKAQGPRRRKGWEERILFFQKGKEPFQVAWPFLPCTLSRGFLVRPGEVRGAQA
jgi:hypothetical protein